MPPGVIPARGIVAARRRGGTLPGVRASYYQNFSSRPAGLVAGNFGPEQDVQAFAVRLPVSSRWDFRFLGLRVEEEAGLYSPGGEGRALGIFGRFAVSPAISLFVEAARGSFDQRGPLEELEGNAFRLGFSGQRGTWGYTLNLRRTDRPSGRRRPKVGRQLIRRPGRIRVRVERRNELSEVFREQVEVGLARLCVSVPVKNCSRVLASDSEANLVRALRRRNRQ